VLGDDDCDGDGWVVEVDVLLFWTHAVRPKTIIRKVARDFLTFIFIGILFAGAGFALPSTLIMGGERSNSNRRSLRQPA
jgi:hypothetical protein